MDYIESKAAGDGPHTGAMIALIPSEEDAAALSLMDDEGENWNELHVTLAFLGVADAISEVDKMLLLKVMQSIAQDTAPFDARVFAVNVFNPKGDEPCLVLGVGGDELLGPKKGVWNILGKMEHMPLPKQHEPWVPHITLKYFDKGDEGIDWNLVSKVASNLPETVRIDRLRVAYAGRYLDFPLTGTPEEPVLAASETKPTTLYRVAAAAKKFGEQQGEHRRKFGHYLTDHEKGDQNCKFCDAKANRVIEGSEGTKVYTCIEHTDDGKEWMDANTNSKHDWTEEKVVRRVRTPGGVRKYGQPIGSIIVRDGRPLANLKITGDSDYEGWVKVRGNNGKNYEVGEEDGKWYATGDGGWDDVAAEADTEDALFEKLDKLAGGGRAKPEIGVPDAPKPAAGGGDAPHLVKAGVSLLRFKAKTDAAPSADALNAIANDLESGKTTLARARDRVALLHARHPKKSTKEGRALKGAVNSLSNFAEQSRKEGGSSATPKPTTETPKPSVSNGPSFKKVKSDYDGYDQYEGENGKTLWSYKEGNQHVIVDEDSNEIERVGRNELLGALNRLLKKDDGKPTGPKPAPKKDPVDSYPNIERAESEYDGYEKFVGKNGKNLWVRSSENSRAQIIEDDDGNELGSAFTESELYRQLNKLGATETPKPAPSPKTPDAIDSAVKGSYDRVLSRGRGLRGKHVEIADLRDEAAKEGVTREEFDASLKRMIEKGGGVEPEPHRHRLDARQRGAAIRIGGEDMHLVNLSGVSGGAAKPVAGTSSSSPTANVRALNQYAKEETREGEILNHPKALELARKRLKEGGTQDEVAKALRSVVTRLRREADNVRRNAGGSAYTHSAAMQESRDLKTSANIYSRIADRLEGKETSKSTPTASTNGSTTGVGGQGHVPSDPDKVELTKPKDIQAGMMVNVGEGGWKYIGMIQKTTRQSAWGGRGGIGSLEGQYALFDAWGEQIAIMSPNHTVEVDKGVFPRSDMRATPKRKPYPSRETYIEPGAAVAGKPNPFEDGYPDFDFNSKKIYGTPVRFEFREIEEDEVGPNGIRTGARYTTKVSIVRRERDKDGKWTERVVSETAIPGDTPRERSAQVFEVRKQFEDLVTSERAKAGVGSWKPWKVPSQKRTPKAKPAPASTSSTTVSGTPKQEGIQKLADDILTSTNNFRVRNIAENLRSGAITPNQAIEQLRQMTASPDLTLGDRGEIQTVQGLISRFNNQSLESRVPSGKSVSEAFTESRIRGTQRTYLKSAPVLAEVAQATYQFKSPTSGYEARVNLGTSYATNSGEISVKGTIHGPDGNKIGFFERTLDARKGSVYNDKITINPKYTGQKFGDEFYEHTQTQLASRGVKKVELDANYDVGGYAWARRGVGWGSEEKKKGARNVALRMEKYLAQNRGELSDTDVKQLERWVTSLRRSPMSGLPTPQQIASFGEGRYTFARKTRAGRNFVSWPGKDIMLGSSWSGEYKLSPQEVKSLSGDEYLDAVKNYYDEADEQFVSDDNYEPHGEESDYNMFYADLFLPPQSGSETKATVVTPGGRIGNNRRTGSRSNGENWIERSRSGELPEYIRIVRNGLMKDGKSESQATALAVAAIKRWARGAGNVTAPVRAAAVRALAQWEKMKAGKSLYLKDARSEVDSAARLEKRRRNLQSRKRGQGREGRSWNEDLHPRKGGKFAPKGSSEGDSSVPESAGKDKAVPESWKKKFPVKYGEQGTYIQRLQEALDAIPGIPKTEKDGIFGDNTTAAIKAFQKKMGIKESGQVDEETFSALINYKE